VHTPLPCATSISTSAAETARLRSNAHPHNDLVYTLPDRTAFAAQRDRKRNSGVLNARLAGAERETREGVGAV
jgi:hypothetical protein